MYLLRRVLVTHRGHWQYFIANLGVSCPKASWWALLRTEGSAP